MRGTTGFPAESHDDPTGDAVKRRGRCITVPSEEEALAKALSKVSASPLTDVESSEAS
jgi:hypothetical protein